MRCPPPHRAVAAAAGSPGREDLIFAKVGVRSRRHRLPRPSASATGRDSATGKTCQSQTAQSPGLYQSDSALNYPRRASFRVLTVDKYVCSPMSARLVTPHHGGMRIDTRNQPGQAGPTVGGVAPAGAVPDSGTHRVREDGDP